MITYQALFREAVQALRAAGKPDAVFDVRCLIEKAFGLDRTALSLHGDESPNAEAERRFRELLLQRAAGEPLQYLIGEWAFLDESFQIGPGVLIPRSETELLALTALQLMEPVQCPVILDLCAGSGCIGVSIARRRPDAQVFLLEKSREAFPYLQRNANHIAPFNTHPVFGDLRDGFGHFDLPAPYGIISNPPYIRSDEIGALQEEVQQEPRMALDGGEDGLSFYPVLASRWLPSLREGGFIAVECGEGQAEWIQALFRQQGLQAQIQVDYREIQRIVVGRKRNSASE